MYRIYTLLFIVKIEQIELLEMKYIDRYNTTLKKKMQLYSYYVRFLKHLSITFLEYHDIGFR